MPSCEISGQFQIEGKASVQRVGAGPLYVVSLRGRVNVERWSAAAQRSVEAWLFQGELDAPELDAEARRKLLDALQQPFFVERTSSGRVLGLRFPRGVERLAQTTWRAWVLETQLALEQGRTWQTQEQDANGHFLARYERDGGSVQKERIRYERGHNPEIVPRVVASHTIFLLERGIVRIDALSDTEWRSDLMGLLSGRVELRLSKVGGSGTSSASHLARAYEEAELLSLTDSGTASSVRSEMDLIKSRGYSWKSALAGLHDTGEVHARAATALISLMRLDPRIAEEAAQHVSKRGPFARELVQMLSEASTDKSHEVLTRLVADASLPRDLRASAVDALALAPEPSKTALDWLQGSLDHEEFSENARLAYGGAARQLAKFDLEGSERIAKSLAERAGTTTGSEQRQYLAALGNAGQTQGLDTLSQMLSHEDESTRVQATLSLRHIQGATPDLLLARQLTDGTPQVRLAALRASNYRAPRSPLVEAVIELMQKEPLIEVRSASVSLGLRWSKDSPTVLGILTVLAERDPDPGIRQAIRAHLGL